MKIEKGLKAVEKLVNNGFKAYLVGGAVRDYLLGIETTDIDITTDALVDDVKNIFLPSVYEISKYGSIKFLFENEELEITTFRKEIEYKDFRHPVFEYTNNIEDDILRRDFTINSLLMDKDKKIIDLNNGLDDLNKKLIKAINNPDKKIKEDALRILRGIRFKAKLNFEIEKNTLDAMIKYKDNLKNISKEVVFKEIKKILNDQYFFNAIDDFLLISDSLNLKETLLILKEKSIEKIDYLTFFTLVYHFHLNLDFNLPKQITNKIKLANELAEVILYNDFNKLLIFSYQEEICLLANKINILIYNDLDKTNEILKLSKEIPIKKICDLKYKGTEIITDLKIEEVSKIGMIVDDIKYMVVTGKLDNDYEIIKQYVLSKYGGLSNEK